MEELLIWLEENQIMFSQDDKVISIEEFGKAFFIEEKNGKNINQEFTFETTKGELDFLESNEDINFLFFKWGSRFYYCAKKLSPNMNTYGNPCYIPQFNLLVNIGEFDQQVNIDFCNLGIHSGYELLNGSGECSNWAKKVKFLKQKSLAIIDKNTLGGTLPMQLACKSLGLKSILGMTASVAHNYSETKENQEKFDVILYVKNAKGWRNLLMINKAINVDYDKFIPEELLLQYGEGLICVFPKNSVINFNIKKSSVVSEILGKYKKAFKSKNLYYQLDFNEFLDDDYDMKNLLSSQMYMKKFHDVLKPVYIPDAYYIERFDSGIKELVNGIGRVTHPSSKEQYLKSIDIIFRQNLGLFENGFEEILFQSIDNTMEISDVCNFEIETGEHKLPKFEVEDPIAFYHQKLEEGFERKIFPKFSDNPDMLEVYIDRLKEENDVIVTAGFVDYFLILWDVIRFCKEVDILVGPGRGSAGGSLVAYLLDIIEIDPIEHDLLFERFLNKTRVSGERAKSADSMPDIDLDFEGLRRQEVKRYMEKKYGADSVCSIGSYGRLKVKSALKDFAKLKGVQFAESNFISKLIEDKANEELKWEDIFMYSCSKPALKSFVQKHSEMVEILTASLMQPKSSSIHASAVLILPKFDKNGEKMTIFDWLPVKKIDGYLVSEWEGKYVERAGFLKEDILGIAQLDKFKKIMQLIKQNKGKNINLNKIPFDKKEVMEYFKKGWTEDVFQFGTSSLKGYSKQVKPDYLTELISMTALYRPGPMKFKAHTDFALIKKGKKEPKFDIGMEKITQYTYGLYVYQEQIMQAMVVGGLTLSESDQVRTYMKKFDRVALSAFEEKFVNGMTKVIKKKSKKEKDPTTKAKEIWDKLNAFSAYGFNKSHSAAYSLMSYWCQYLKVKHPLEFWTASLNFADEKKEIPNRLSEINAIDNMIEVKQPDINMSRLDFTSYPDEQKIYWSLSKIKKVGAVAVEKILEAKDLDGEFFDLQDFLKRVPKNKVNKGVVTNLIIAGAFDNIGGKFGMEIKSIKERYDILCEYYEIIKQDVPEEIEASENKGKNWFWILKQKQITGFGNINYKDLIAQLKLKNKKFEESYVPPEEFELFENKFKWGTPAVIAGNIMFIKEIKSRNGEMASISIESNNNILLVTVWPDNYKSLIKDFYALQESGKILAISGVIKFDDFKEKNIFFTNKETKIYEIS